MGRTATALLGIVTVVSTTAGLGAGLLGAVVGAVFWGAITWLAGWLTAAWRDERPWAWWVWTVGAAVLVLSGLNAVVDGVWFAVPAVLAGAVLLLLLAHPDSRARIDGRTPRSPAPPRPGPPVGRPGQYH